MPVIDIPGGQATLREKLVTERQFDLIEAAGTAAGPALQKLFASRGEGFDELPEEQQQAELANVQLSFEEALSLKVLQRAAIVAFLEHWTIRQPLPTIDTVADLPREVFRPLEAAVTPLMLSVLGGASHVDFDPQPGKTDAEGNEHPTGASEG